MMLPNSVKTLLREHVSNCSLFGSAETSVRSTQKEYFLLWLRGLIRWNSFEQCFVQFENIITAYRHIGLILRVVYRDVVNVNVNRVFVSADTSVRSAWKELLLYYIKWYLLDQSIPKMLNLILKTKALVAERERTLMKSENSFAVIRWLFSFLTATICFMLFTCRSFALWTVWYHSIA